MLLNTMDTMGTQLGYELQRISLNALCLLNPRGHGVPSNASSSIERSMQAHACVLPRAACWLNLPPIISVPPCSICTQLAKSHRSMERKALLQMAAVSHRPMLLSLTEEGVSLHTLPDMSLKCLALRSKGGSAFAWQEDLKVLAVAVKRKVRVCCTRCMRAAALTNVYDTQLKRQCQSPGMLAARC